MPSTKYHMARFYTYGLSYNGKAITKYTERAKKVFTTSLPQNLAYFYTLVSN